MREEHEKTGRSARTRVLYKNHLGNLNEVVDVRVNYGTASSTGPGSVPHIQIITKPIKT